MFGFLYRWDVAVDFEDIKNVFSYYSDALHLYDLRVS
jgi:hypothetical protein